MRQCAQAENEKRILEVCQNADYRSGIYAFTRYDDGFKYAYVGQAKNLLRRIAQHLSGYQHIDLSIKKRGFYSERNPTGWYVEIARLCDEFLLDEMERDCIKSYAGSGFQLLNKTSGGQGEGKTAIAEQKPSRGYYDGLEQGGRNERRDLRKIFKHLHIMPKTSRYGEKAMDKFEEFMGEEVIDDAT